MESFLAYCSIFCLFILASGGVNPRFEMKSIIPLKGSSLEFSCCMLEGFNKNNSITIWNGTSTVTTCDGNTYSCDFFRTGYNFAANITGAFGVITNLTTADQGTWRCSYKINGTLEDVYSKDWELIVYTIPSRLSITQNPAQDGDLSVNSIELQCKTVGCTYPMPTVKWIFKDQSTASEYGYSTSNPCGVQDTCTGLEMIFTSKLTLPQYTAFNDSSDKTGTFLCRIDYPDPSMDISSLESNAVTFSVYVKSITMSPSGSPLIFLEGQEKSVQCITSPSRPRPQVRWWLGKEQILHKITESSSGNLIITTSVISLTLNRSHTHKVLYCDAAVSGQQAWISSTKSDVTVQYVPDVRVNISGSTAVGFTAVLMCTAQGEPSQYTFHPWIHIVGQTEIRKINGENTNNISSLTLSNISIQDMGSYICTVDNSITGLDGQLYQTVGTSLHVQGPPVFGETDTIFTGEIGESATIEIPFYSSSSTTTVNFIKHLDSFVISNTSNVSIYIFPSIITLTFYTENVMMPGHVAVLFFRNVTDKDFVHYKIQLSSEKGNMTMVFDFIAKDSMYAPSVSDSSPVGVSVGGAVGLGVGCFVLGCIVTFIAFTIRRQINVSKNSCFRRKGRTDDVTYSNTEMTSQPIKPIYEELKKGTVEHNMYDKIEHSADGT